METLESLKRKIESAKTLQSIVRTMKALAAVNIRQYEKAVESLYDYSRAVEMGFQVLLKTRPEEVGRAKTAPRQRVGAIIFGSDQGMCGQLNDQIVTHALESLKELGLSREDWAALAVGFRVTARLEDAGCAVEESFSVPNSVFGITPAVQEVLMKVSEWRLQAKLDRILLFYNRLVSGATYRPHTEVLLPIDQEWLRNLAAKSWPSRVLPFYTMAWDDLFSSLVWQYLFISLYQSFAESLASENASRLASMQRAEKNIAERLEELTAYFHQQRQMTITSELLDIVAGFEAMSTPGERSA